MLQGILDLVWAIIGIALFLKALAWFHWVVVRATPKDLGKGTRRLALKAKAVEDGYRSVYPAEAERVDPYDEPYDPDGDVDSLIDKID